MKMQETKVYIEDARFSDTLLIPELDEWEEYKRDVESRRVINYIPQEGKTIIIILGLVSSLTLLCISSFYIPVPHKTNDITLWEPVCTNETLENNIFLLFYCTLIGFTLVVIPTVTVISLASLVYFLIKYLISLYQVKWKDSLNQ